MALSRDYNEDWAIAWINQETGVDVRAIPGFPGYFADANGDIWSVRAPGGGLELREPHCLRLNPAREHPCYSLWTENGVAISVAPARAVCLAFHGPPPADKPIALHLHRQFPPYPDNVEWNDVRTRRKRVLREQRLDDDVRH